MNQILMTNLFYQVIDNTTLGTFPNGVSFSDIAFFQDTDYPEVVGDQSIDPRNRTLLFFSGLDPRFEHILEVKIAAMPQGGNFSIAGFEVFQSSSPSVAR